MASLSVKNIGDGVDDLPTLPANWRRQIKSNQSKSVNSRAERLAADANVSRFISCDVFYIRVFSYLGLFLSCLFLAIEL